MPRRIVTIMAGGAGERFWPISRMNVPKQLLPLTGGDSMLQISIDRVRDFVGIENIFILTAARLVDSIRALLPDMPPENIIGEPAPRNTAPCLGLALAHTGYDPSDPPVMGVLTADHAIHNTDEFIANLETAYDLAAGGEWLVTLGIPPTHPDTGFGYLELGGPVEGQAIERVLRVGRFREKPNLEDAERFVASGNFLWNSGMFFWRNDRLFSAFQQHMPNLAEAINEMRAGVTGGDPSVVERVFPEQEKISIDYGIMERETNVACVRATFDWDDIGTWEAVSRHNPTDTHRNVLVGDAQALDSQGNILYVGEGAPAISVLGVDDLIVVSSKDAVMVCKRDEAQRVKEIVTALKEKDRADLV